MADALRLGLLYSVTGPYAPIGRQCRDGAELAVADLTRAGGLPFAVETVSADPGGDPARYTEDARAMLRGGCRQIVGTITSLSRKEIIPLIEKHDGLLWYTSPYEGFEANENVIYTGACPNQHLVPLIDYLLPRFGGRAYLAGANYVWGWEMNRLARELIVERGGEILAERYLPIDETEVDRLIADIQARRPDFILNNLVGPSSYAFLRAYRRLGEAQPDFAPERRPVVSCNLTECELASIGAGVATGLLSTAPYFESLETPDNRAFRDHVSATLGPDRRVSAFFAGTYTAVRLCLEAIAAAGSDDPAAVKRALTDRPLATLFGRISIDPRTHHATLPCHLGRIGADDRFEILSSTAAIAADPYLTRNQAPRAGLARAPFLKVVS